VALSKKKKKTIRETIPCEESGHFYKGSYKWKDDFSLEKEEQFYTKVE
jgi:hypothetical protein